MQKKGATVRQVLAANLQGRMKNDPAIATQPLLAERSGVDQGYISRVLRGEAGPTIDVVEKLAHGCRCQPWELLVDTDATREAAYRKILG